MDYRKIAFAAAGALLALALFLTWLWQPERQVRLHTASFLRAVEKRDWEKVAGLMAENYSDRWEHDKEFVLTNSREVFRQFVSLKIENVSLATGSAGAVGSTETKIKISGGGSPIAQLVMEKVNTLAQPFTFHWGKSGSKPWDWQLTRIDQSELDLDIRGF